MHVASRRATTNFLSSSRVRTSMSITLEGVAIRGNLVIGGQHAAVYFKNVRVGGKSIFGEEEPPASKRARVAAVLEPADVRKAALSKVKAARTAKDFTRLVDVIKSSHNEPEVLIPGLDSLRGLMAGDAVFKNEACSSSSVYDIVNCAMLDHCANGKLLRSACRVSTWLYSGDKLTDAALACGAESTTLVLGCFSVDGGFANSAACSALIQLCSHPDWARHAAAKGGILLRPCLSSRTGSLSSTTHLTFCARPFAASKPLFPAQPIR